MSVDILVDTKRFTIVSHVWILKAFESQMRVCLFDYRQIMGAFCILKQWQGVVLLFKRGHLKLKMSGFYSVRTLERVPSSPQGGDTVQTNSAHWTRTSRKSASTCFLTYTSLHTTSPQSTLVTTLSFPLIPWAPPPPRQPALEGPIAKWHFTSGTKEREEMREEVLKGSLSFPRGLLTEPFTWTDVLDVRAFFKGSTKKHLYSTSDDKDLEHRLFVRF